MKPLAHSASLHTQPGSAISNARLAAELQAVALAIRIGGLEGLRNGSVRLTTPDEGRDSNEGEG